MGFIIACVAVHSIDRLKAGAYDQGHSMCFASHGDIRPQYAFFIKNEKTGKDDIALKSNR